MSRSLTFRRGFAGFATGAVAAGLLVPAAAGASAPPGDGSAADFEPVTIEHRMGTTEITARPERIVSLDGQWTDTLISLGEPPLGYFVDPIYGSEYPWEDGLLTGTRIEATDSVPYEAIAALDPDLIVVSWAATDPDVYESLVEIAPTIGMLTEAAVNPWQLLVETGGEVLGLEDRAAEVIDEVEATVDQVRAEFPGLAGQTFSFANYVPGDAIYVLTDPDDGANAFFRDVGLELPEQFRDVESELDSRYVISTEQITLLDADIVLLLTNGADPADIPGYAALPAVVRGSALAVDYPTAVALNTPSSLSLPWGIERLRPVFEAATG